MSHVSQSPPGRSGVGICLTRLVNAPGREGVGRCVTWLISHSSQRYGDLWKDMQLEGCLV